MIEARALALKAAMQDVDLEKANRYLDWLEGAKLAPAYDEVMPEKETGDWWQAGAPGLRPNPAVADDERSPVPSQYYDPLPVKEPEPIAEAAPERKERKPRKAKAAKGKRGRPRKADKEAAAEPVANGAAEHIAAPAEASPIPDQIAA